MMMQPLSLAMTKIATATMKSARIKPMIIGLLICNLSACNGLLQPPTVKTDTLLANALPNNQYPQFAKNAYNTANNSTNNSVNSNAENIATKPWQDFFSDPQLKQLIQQGLNHNRDLRTASLNIARAQAQYQLTSSAQLPNVVLSDTGTSISGNTSSTNKAYAVNLGLASYELDFWGRVANLKEQALNNFLASQSARNTAQMSLINQIAQSYITLQFDQQQLSLASKTLQAQQASYQLNEKRYQYGVIPLLTLKQAQIGVENAKLAVQNYQTQITLDHNILSLLVGQPVAENATSPVATQSIITSQKLNRGLPSDLLLHRPDIVQAEYNLKAAGANIAVARAAYFPSISLTSTVGYASTHLSDLFTSGAFKWSILPNISLPIFDAGHRKAVLDTAKVDQQLAINGYEKAIQTAFKEVVDVLAVRATIDERIATQTRLVEASQANYDISQARYKAGIDSFFNVLTAQTTLFSAQQNLLLLQQTALISQINLYTKLGGGL